MCVYIYIYICNLYVYIYISLLREGLWLTSLIQTAGFARTVLMIPRRRRKTKALSHKIIGSRSPTPCERRLSSAAFTRQRSHMSYGVYNDLVDAIMSSRGNDMSVDMVVANNMHYVSYPRVQVPSRKEHLAETKATIM